MARKHNKRANKRSQSVDIKAYAQQLEGVFSQIPRSKIQLQTTGRRNWATSREMVKAKIEMALSDLWSASGTILMVDQVQIQTEIHLQRLHRGGC